MIRRIAYLGTPEMAVPPLQALLDAGFDIAVVVTGADKRRGRGSELSPSPVKRAALDAGLTVVHDVDAVLSADVSLGVVVAYGRLIKPHVLAEVPMVNLHFSLLPRWRGAAPVERALLAGDDVTGVCLMEVAEDLDTGGVFSRVEVAIGPTATLASLREDLVAAGTDLLIDGLVGGLGSPSPQVGEPLYAHKITPADLIIDWARPTPDIDRQIRLGGAHTTFRGARLKVLEAVPVPDDVAPGAAGQLSSGVVSGLQLVTVQPQGKRPMSYAEFANGARLQPGERLGE